MAERSFATEVRQLRHSAGTTPHVEGILAVTKALLQSGVAYVGGYQGAPISHLMDVLGDAHDILDELDVYFENSASEATAAAMLGASVHYPLRGAVTFKSTVGLNVASDALANLAGGGVTGGALVILGEDYGEGKVIVAQSECRLNRQRRERPRTNKAIREGKRVVRERFGVDAETCTGDHACIRISGCPSLTLAANPNPMRTDPVATVTDTCIGCGVCGANAHAASLCPSFHRTDVVVNPTRRDRVLARIRTAWIAALSAPVERRAAKYEVA
ncbi:hypothetical protein [Embleya sp. MST-111070]|uniref:hypothetical protein n=1 Tax=Embleya sp. MST-111070 TaxID=3398231 RepID=UPI003F7382F2